MDYWFPDDNSEGNGTGDLIYNFEQPSPTPRIGQSSNSIMLPRMSIGQSSESLNDLPHPGCPSSDNLFSYPWGPKEGWAGSNICIKLDVTAEGIYAYGGSPDAMVIIVGDYTLHTTNRLLTGGPSRLRGGQTRILSAVMPESGTGLDYESGDSLPITVQLIDSRNECAEILHMGDYTFTPDQGMLGAPGVPKRERENDLVEIDRSRPQPQPQTRWSGQRGSSGNAALPPPLPPNMVGHPMASQMANMGNSFDSQTMYINAPTPNMSEYLPLSLRIYTDHSAPWGNPFGPGPLLPSLHAMGGQIALTPCLQPQLMRSSQVPSRPDFNIYDAPKAEVHIAGDLATMAKGWTSEEWAAKRRLVKVWRRQDGHNIFLAFAPMPQLEWHAEKDCVVISCMFREDRNSCWVTSVDMLYLLEAVIGTRFSVEEKNRIRRNLEGFRPQTVSKNKSTSDTFFRTIMSYPAPKPRNIEKDVKVFPFEVVAAAIKKIVSKYVSPISYSQKYILMIDCYYW